MIDEIDKMGSDWRGDPSSAMLEVLDPEQNSSFRDHYLDLPFDLSKVMFICTANVLDTIPGPLRDRMEIISIAGYTQEEKLHIARRYLRASAGGAQRPQERASSTSPTPRCACVIEGYTREAGVRNLERQIGTIARKFARMVAEEGRKRLTVGEKQVTEFLGRQKVFRETKRKRTSDPGVSTGLAWTPTGGDILFIEARAMPGSGRLILTGQLGDVMKESAQAALTYVRSIAEQLGADADYFQKHDIHVHVPAGAVPKDGPSAGVAMAVALASMVSGRAVDPQRGHDRRGDAHRAGAAGRRHQGEGAGRAGGGHHAGSSCPTATRPTSTRSGRRPAHRAARSATPTTCSAVLDQILVPAEEDAGRRRSCTPGKDGNSRISAGCRPSGSRSTASSTTRPTSSWRCTERDLPALFENALFALYDQLAELEDFETTATASTIRRARVRAPSDALRALLSEALYRFETQALRRGRAQPLHVETQASRRGRGIGGTARRASSTGSATPSCRR